MLWNGLTSMILLPPGLHVPPRIRSFPTYFSAKNPRMHKLSIPLTLHAVTENAIIATKGLRLAPICNSICLVISLITLTEVMGLVKFVDFEL